MKGIGASKGLSEGICISLDDYLSNNYESDLILVVEFLPPYISELKDVVKGVIAEDGGILSHAACISREFGIPCVVGVPNAIKELEKKHVLINGESGEIICK